MESRHYRGTPGLFKLILRAAVATRTTALYQKPLDMQAQEGEHLWSDLECCVNIHQIDLLLITPMCHPNYTSSKLQWDYGRTHNTGLSINF